MIPSRTRPAAWWRRLRQVAFAGTLAASIGSVASFAPAAESIWNMEGLGRPLDGYSVAARGAGSTAIASADPYELSFVNPALVANARLPQGHFGFQGQNRWTAAEGADGTGRRFDARLTAGRFVLLGPGPIRWGIGYTDLTDGTYQLRFRMNRGRDDEFQRELKGRGGVGELSLAIASPLLGDRLRAGVQLGLANGTMRDEVEDDFSGTTYLNTSSKLRTRVQNGRTVGFGLAARVAPRLQAGASYRFAAGVDLKEIWRIAGNTEWQETASFELPATTGLGLAWLASPRWRVSLDWNHQAWASSDFRLRTSGSPSGDGSDAAATGGFGALRDTDRLGIGLTRMPSTDDARRPLLQRTVWRTGFSWGQLPVAQAGSGGAGEQVNEWMLTAGCGFPVQVDRGYLDLVLELGRTGDLGSVGYRETFVRFGAGISFGRLAEKY